MTIEPLQTISWAYQLHYYICFRTRRCRSVFTAPKHAELLNAVLREICQRHNYHLLQSKVYPDHLRCLLSLRPEMSISTVIQTIKANSARLFNAQFALTPPLWGRGFLARSVGRVRLNLVKQYISKQAEHHGYDRRIRPPISRFKIDEPVILTSAHSSFDLNHHLVVATQYRRGVFGSTLGEELIRYWQRVASTRGFAIDRVTIVPDHAHLLVRIQPENEHRRVRAFTAQQWPAFCQATGAACTDSSQDRTAVASICLCRNNWQSHDCIGEGVPEQS